jgi:hypothetical protein
VCSGSRESDMSVASDDNLSNGYESPDSADQLHDLVYNTWLVSVPSIIRHLLLMRSFEEKIVPWPAPATTFDAGFSGFRGEVSESNPGPEPRRSKDTSFRRICFHWCPRRHLFHYDGEPFRTLANYSVVAITSSPRKRL